MVFISFALFVWDFAHMDYVLAARAASVPACMEPFYSIYRYFKCAVNKCQSDINIPAGKENLFHEYCFNH
ncbi:MAG TPA: hypothetical protein DF613_15270 [Lachnospiraceae bacterium]|nr:hypothetical protein [Lachnospiraceae bacterium]